MSNKYMHYAYFETTNIFKKLQERGYKIQNCLLVECSLSLRWKMNSNWQRLEKTLATFDFFDSWKFHNKMCLLPITVALTSPTRSIEDFFCSGEIHSKIYRVFTLLHPFRKRAFEQNYPGGPFHYGPSDWSKIIQEGIVMFSASLQSSEVALKLIFILYPKQKNKKDFPTKDQTDQIMCLMSGT